MWFYYGKPGHIARFCYKVENKERENAKNAKAEDKLAFALQHEAHLKSVCKCGLLLLELKREA
jgi:hypothetical protein